MTVFTVFNQINNYLINPFWMRNSFGKYFPINYSYDQKYLEEELLQNIIKKKTINQDEILKHKFSSSKQVYFVFQNIYANYSEYMKQGDDFNNEISIYANIKNNIKKLSLKVN